MTVFPRLDDRATWAANAICAKAVLKQHALLGKFVDIRSWVDFLVDAIIGSDGVRRMVVSEYKYNVRSVICRSRRSEKKEAVT